MEAWLAPTSNWYFVSHSPGPLQDCVYSGGLAPTRFETVGPISDRANMTGTLNLPSTNGNVASLPPPQPSGNAESERLGPVSSFLVFCSGADKDLLARGGTETATFVGLGGTVLATALLAVVSSTFFLSIGFGLAWWSMLPFSLVWGLIIFNLDRWLLTSFRKLSNPVWTFISLLPRLALAALIGFLIAEPMILEIFRVEIAEELRDINEETRQTRLEAIASGPESTQIENKRAEILALESRLGRSDDADIAQFQADIDQERALVEGWESEIAIARAGLLESQASLEEEVIDGCLDGGESCAPGSGPIARQKEREVELRQQELDAIEARLDPNIAESDVRIAELQDSIDTRRAELSDRLNAADDDINQEVRQLRGEIDDLEQLMTGLSTNVIENEAESGVLARVDALERIRERSGNVNRLYWLLTLLFIALDTIPILGKWFMSLGAPRPYERLRDAKERGIGAVVTSAIERHEVEEQVQSASTKYLASTRTANDQYFINHWAMINRSLGEARLAAWEQAEAPDLYAPVPMEALPTVGLTSDQPLEELVRQPAVDEAKTNHRSVFAATLVLILIAALAGGFLFMRSGGEGIQLQDGNQGGVLREEEAPESSAAILPDIDEGSLDKTEPEATAEPGPTTTITRPAAADTTTSESVKGEVVQAGGQDADQLASLEGLIGDPDPGRPSYDREQFNEGQDLDGDCVRTRHEVLIEEGSGVTVQDCKVASGVWNDAYTGLTLTDPAELQVDHVVALNDAWDSGAWAFTASQRESFSNSAANLNAIHGPENERKANLGPSRYSPARPAQTCAYLRQYSAVKIEWGLSVTRADFDAIEGGLANCDGESVEYATQGLRGEDQMVPTTTAQVPTTFDQPPDTEQEATTTSTSSDCHPSYSPCLPRVGDLNCGDIPSRSKPVTVLGSDPYGLDADDDGTGCDAG